MRVERQAQIDEAEESIVFLPGDWIALKEPVRGNRDDDDRRDVEEFANRAGFDQHLEVPIVGYTQSGQSKVAQVSSQSGESLVIDPVIARAKSQDGSPRPGPERI